LGDNLLQGLLAKVDMLEQLGALGPVHILKAAPHDVGLALDLVGEDLVAVNRGHRMDLVENPRADSPKGEHYHDQTQDNPDSPRVGVLAHYVEHRKSDLSRSAFHIAIAPHRPPRR